MRSRLLPLLLTSLALVAACGDDPATPVQPRPGGLTVSAPDLVVTGRPFALTVTAVDADGGLDTGFAGTVNLTASLGSFSPATITLAAGAGSADVVLSGAFGSVTVTAHAGQRAGEAVIATVAVGELPGAATVAAAPAIPAMDYVPDLRGFANDHPDLPGMWLSFSQVLVSLTPGATVGQVNAMLTGVGAIIVGGIPGPAGGGGTLALLLPVADHDGAAPLLAQVEGDPSVTAVAPDILLGGTMITRDNDGFPDAWTWTLPPAGDNWGLEHIRAPQAWNLNAAIEKAGSTGPVTDVIDAGFATNHPDIAWHQLLSPSGQSAHGTHVAGTIGATFDNGLGVDGVNPFARIRAIGPTFHGTSTA